MLEQEFPLSVFRLMPSIQNVNTVEINLFHRTNWNFSWWFDNITVSFQDENLSQTDDHAGLMTGDWAMRGWPHSLIGGWELGAFSVFWGISWSFLELNEVTILQEAMWCYRSFTLFLWRKFIFAPWIQKPTIFMHNVQTVSGDSLQWSSLRASSPIMASRATHERTRKWSGEVVRGGGKESLQQSLINVHFCFALKKQNTSGWTMMHCQFFLNFDLCISWLTCQTFLQFIFGVLVFLYGSVWISSWQII